MMIPVPSNLGYLRCSLDLNHQMQPAKVAGWEPRKARCRDGVLQGRGTRIPYKIFRVKNSLGLPLLAPKEYLATFKNNFLTYSAQSRYMTAEM